MASGAARLAPTHQVMILRRGGEHMMMLEENVTQSFTRLELKQEIYQQHTAKVVKKNLGWISFRVWRKQAEAQRPEDYGSKIKRNSAKFS